MKISTSTLGIIAMAASPFLFIQLYVDDWGVTSIGGLCGLIYMIGWACTIVALLRLNATGTARKNKVILYIQLATLTVAQAWNIWTIADPQNSNPVYAIIDFFWPMSNILLLVIGIIIAVKGVLTGWKRYMVLIAGSWLPISLLIFNLMGQETSSLVVSGLYSTIAWFGMGNMVWKSARTTGISLNKPVRAL